jgi:hypothetical protein
VHADASESDIFLFAKPADMDATLSTAAPAKKTSSPMTIEELIAIEKPSRQTPILVSAAERSEIGGTMEESPAKGVRFGPIFNDCVKEAHHPSTGYMLEMVKGTAKMPFELLSVVKEVEEALQDMWKKLGLDKLSSCTPIIAGGWIEHCITCALLKKLLRPDPPSGFMMDDGSEHMKEITACELIRTIVPPGDMHYWWTIEDSYLVNEGGRDTDIFLCYSESQSKSVAAELRKYLGSQLASSRLVAVSRAGYTISRRLSCLSGILYRCSGRDRHYQLLPVRGFDPSDVINSFDLDCCAAYFDGKNIFALPRAIEAWKHRANIFRPSAITQNGERRIIKYCELGYEFIIPDEYGFDPESVDRSLPIVGGGFRSLLPIAQSEPSTSGEAKPVAVEDAGYFSAHRAAIADCWNLGMVERYITAIKKGKTPTYSYFPGLKCKKRPTCNCDLPRRDETSLAIEARYAAEMSSTALRSVEDGSTHSEAELSSLKQKFRYEMMFQTFLDGSYDKEFVHITTCNVHAVFPMKICRPLWANDYDRAVDHANEIVWDIDRRVQEEMLQIGTDAKFPSVEDIVIRGAPITIRSNASRTARQNENWFCFKPVENAEEPRWSLLLRDQIFTLAKSVLAKEAASRNISDEELALLVDACVEPLFYFINDTGDHRKRAQRKEDGSDCKK